MAESFPGHEAEVVVCGTLVADIRVRPFRPVLQGERDTLRHVDQIVLIAGGLVSNSGLALARLGVPTLGLGQLGDDALGELIAAALARGGLRMEGIYRRRDSASDAVVVCVDERGERTFHYASGANKLLGLEQIEAQLPALRAARAIMLGYLGELPYLDPHLPDLLARLKRESGATLVLETAGPQTSTRPLLDACLPHVDIFIPSWSEARDLTGAATAQEALDDLARVPGPEVLGIKLGAQGCLVRDAHGIHAVPAYPAAVVDATGAGDAFLAGFVAAYLRGHPTPEACRLGNMAGALFIGAIDGAGRIPPFAELLARVRAAG